MLPDPAFPFPSVASQRGAFVYVLPCHGEDLLKLGHSRDPLARMHALHPRFFEFFDLQQAFAVETETVREARQLEKRFGRALALHAAVAPLTVNPAAGGHTEWLRGAYAELAALAQQHAAAGLILHAPLRPWLRQRLIDAGELLYSWTQLLDPLLLQARGPDSRATPAQRRVADVLDAYRAEELDLARWLPANVLNWHAAASLR